MIKDLAKFPNRPLVYVSGPFRASTPEGIMDNIRVAEEEAAILWEAGFSVICPHANTRFLNECTDEMHECCLEGDYRMIQGCDALILIKNWEKSAGAMSEFTYARTLKMPVFKLSGASDNNVYIYDYEHDSFRLFAPQEDKYTLIREYICQYPQQFLAFRELSAYGYHLMVRKNKDYSPFNIKGTGKVGIATRLWDKCARYLNLVGFNIETGEYSAPKIPNNESIEDNLLDLSNYGHIGNIHSAGVWGK